MAYTRRNTSKVISTKDDVSLEESLRMIAHHRKDDETGLILPVDLVRERKQNCSFCGKAFDNSEKMLYFDELFHKKCAEKMCRGERN